MSAPLRITSGPAIQHAGDLAAILSGLNEGDVLFIDEIHRMARPAEEMLYMAMEDFRVDVIVGKGPGATAIPLELPPFTLVGATTRAGLLPARCATGSASPRTWSSTTPAELDRIVHRSAGLLGVDARRPTAPPRSPSRSRGTPRIANRLLRRVRDYAQVRADGVVTLDDRPARRSSSTRSTSSGLDRLDRAVLDALCRRFGGGPVGVSHARGRGRRGARDRRGGRRAVPGARRLPGPHAARPGRHARRLAPPRAGASTPPYPSRPCSRTDHTSLSTV